MSDEVEEFNQNQLWLPEKTLKLRSKPKKLSANDNVDQVYEAIGGIPRHAEWANENPTEFYTRHYARRIVSESNNVISGEIRILPALSRSDLDDPIPSTAEDITDGHTSPVSAPAPLPALSRQEPEVLSHGRPPTGGEDSRVHLRINPPGDLLEKEAS